MHFLLSFFTETKKFDTYLRNSVESQRIQTYISFHSAAQKLLFPYAAHGSRPPNNKDLQRIGEKAIIALGQRYRKQFQVGSAYSVMYEAAGTSLDYVYSKLNVPIVYTYELRRAEEEPQNFQDRFLLPVDQIEAAGWETLDSVVALLNEAKTLGYYKLDSSSHYAVIFFCKGMIQRTDRVCLTFYFYFVFYRHWFECFADGCTYGHLLWKKVQTVLATSSFR